MRAVSAALLAFACTVIAAAATSEDNSAEQAEAIAREVQRSHIEGNVPPPADFDRFLARDLAAYFSRAGQPPPRINYELLRDEPTQSGVSYPKYYIWVRVTDSGVTKQGAARIAAIARSRFEVTHFVESSEIERAPSQLQMLFPPAVAARIEEKIKAQHP